MSGASKKILIEETTDSGGASRRVSAVNAVMVEGTKSTTAVPQVQADGTVEWKTVDALAYDGDITTLDIDGGTDIGADLADADLLIVDDGAGGTNRKSAISRIWTYTTGKLTSTGIASALLTAPAADTTATGLIETDTVGEGVAFGNLLYMKSDGKWWKADADAAATMPGMRLALATASADASCSMLVLGRARDDSWAWTVGGEIYASTTAGGLTQTAPSGTGDQVQVVGVAYHADKIIFNPSLTVAEVA